MLAASKYFFLHSFISRPPCNGSAPPLEAHPPLALHYTNRSSHLVLILHYYTDTSTFTYTTCVHMVILTLNPILYIFNMFMFIFISINTLSYIYVSMHLCDYPSQLVLQNKRLTLSRVVWLTE